MLADQMSFECSPSSTKTEEVRFLVGSLICSSDHKLVAEVKVDIYSTWAETLAAAYGVASHIWSLNTCIWEAMNYLFFHYLKTVDEAVIQPKDGLYSDCDSWSCMQLEMHFGSNYAQR